jgi:hypothetical protein
MLATERLHAAGGAPRVANARRPWLSVALIGAFLGGAGVLLNAGCGGKIALPSIPVAGFAHALAVAYCEEIAGCCATNGIPTPGADCVANAEAAYAASYPLAPGYWRSGNYDGTVAYRCVEALRARLRLCTWRGHAQDDDRYPEVCANVYAGTQPIGAMCNDVAECAPSPSGNVICPGRCLEVVTRGLGEPCAEPNRVARCGAGNFCRFVSATEGTCDRLRANGETCVNRFECTSGRCLDGACVPLLQPGEPCDGNSFYCVNHGQCVGVPGACSASLPVGATCDQSDPKCADACNYESRCTTFYWLDSGTCAGFVWHPRP